MKMKVLNKPKGFTLIEVMVTLIITVIGLGAIFLTQSANSRAQGSVRDMIYAVNLAELTLKDLRLEGLEWTTNTGQDLSQSKLKRLIAMKQATPDGGTPPSLTPGDDTGWILAFHHASSSQSDVFTVGPAGGDVSENYSGKASYDNGIANEFPSDRLRRYCVWYRLSWVIPDYVMRADVQVAWPKRTGFNANTSYWDCPISMVSDMNMVNFVTLSTTISRYGSVE